MLYLYTYLNVWMNSLKKEEGQGMAEYGLILALIAIVVAVALGLLGDAISGFFDGLTAEF